MIPPRVTAATAKFDGLLAFAAPVRAITNPDAAGQLVDGTASPDYVCVDGGRI